MDLRTMATKGTAPGEVKAALNMLQRQSELQVKAIRCDGSKENGTLRVL